MVRAFKLINAHGDEFNLMRTDAFFYSPDGLGINYHRTFSRVGTHYLQTKDYKEQKTISGTMVFNGYKEYSEFSAFIGPQPLTLCYTPRNTMYKIDCYVESLEKGEINHSTNRLECDITFVCSTLFYINKRAITMSTEYSASKTYSYDYNYTYSESQRGSITATNESPDDASAILTINGPVTNPAWYLTVNDEQIQTGKITGTIADGNKLVVDSRDGHLEIAEYTRNNTWVSDLYQSADFDRENFLYIPSGPFRLIVTADNQSAVNCTLEVIEEYETV